jgi:hypothetical protein
MPSYLVVTKAIFRLDIWVFRFTIGDLQKLTGNWLWNDYKYSLGFYLVCVLDLVKVKLYKVKLKI